ncbi:MAG: helix-turn-helix transcriptional regulator [Acidobacteriota bacterium]
MRNLLKNLELYVLLALARGPLHGYGLATQIEDDSDGQLKPLPGNLYVVLKRLQQGGLVRPLEAGPREAKKRRAYELTDLGQRRLAAESERMATFARTADLRFSPGEEQG